MLINHMNSLIQEISWGIPRIQKIQLTLICRECDVYAAVQAIPGENNSKIAGICVCDESWKSYSGSRLKECQSKFSDLDIPIIPGKHTIQLAHTVKSAYVPKASQLSFAELKHAHVRIRRFMLRYGFFSYCIYSDVFESVRPYRTPSPKLYTRYQNELEQVYAMLETDEDKDTFARYTKALISGDFGYVRENQEPAYHHAKARVNPGDIIMDAGISSNIKDIVRFSDLTGPEGRVFGFEVDPAAFNKANEKVQAMSISNITLVNLGLWDTDTQLMLQTDGCPHIAKQGLDAQSEPGNLCSVQKLDSFIAENRINKVDIIKMDIEGAEVEALCGARNTICTFSPTLLICIYHDPKHLFKIPLMIKTWQPNYKFYLKQESWLTKELLLIATM
jgi:methyltransferase, FkbM family